MVTKEHVAEIKTLLDEFKYSYPYTDKGKRHIALYTEARASAKSNYQDILNGLENKRDLTEEILLKLLPHNDFKSNSLDQ